MGPAIVRVRHRAATSPTTSIVDRGQPAELAHQLAAAGEGRSLLGSLRLLEG